MGYRGWTWPRPHKSLASCPHMDQPNVHFLSCPTTSIGVYLGDFLHCATSWEPRSSFKAPMMGICTCPLRNSDLHPRGAHYLQHKDGAALIGAANLDLADQLGVFVHQHVHKVVDLGKERPGKVSLIALRSPTSHVSILSSACECPLSKPRSPPLAEFCYGCRA